MYIDLIVFIILLIIVIMNYNKFHSYILFIAIVDITLRLLTYLKDNLPFGKITKYISDYLPGSLLDMINKYTTNWGVINVVLRWVYIGIMVIFLYYVGKIFIKKKKI